MDRVNHSQSFRLIEEKSPQTPITPAKQVNDATDEDTGNSNNPRPNPSTNERNPSSDSETPAPATSLNSDVRGSAGVRGGFEPTPAAADDPDDEVGEV